MTQDISDAPTQVLQAARFNLAGAPQTLRSEAELESQLQRRLRLLSLLVAGLAPFFFAMLALGAGEELAALSPIRGWSALTVATVFTLVFSAAYGASGVALAPTRRRSLAVLRVTQAVGFAVPTLIWVAVSQQALVLRVPASASSAWLLALALTMIWPSAMIGYAVFMPNTFRRGAIAIAVMIVVALVPDFITVAMQWPARDIVWTYVAAKAFWVIDTALLAMYGSYRIEVLRADANAARQLGQYRLKQRLGAGGMGEVYLAEHQLLRRPCAVKLIRGDREGGPDADAIARFEREVQATATLTHPNTIQIYDYGRAEDGTFYYAMEYLGGESLEQLVQREGPMPPARVVRWLAQLCGALGEAHERGLLHRDIKPTNIIVCERGGVKDVAKLLDFGLVIPIDKGADATRLTMAGAIVGTPAFMSPEQCVGEPMGPPSDIYSLGAVGYYLLSGRVLFENRNLMQTLVAHMQVAPTPFAESGVRVPSGLESLIFRCLAKRADERYASTAALAAALDRCATTEAPVPMAT